MAAVGGMQRWYAEQYGGPFRSSRLRAPSLLPDRRVPAAVQQTLVVDAARQGANATAQADKDGEKNVRRRETIFGPDVGEDDEPGWTKPDEGAKVGVETVKAWVERAKAEEGLHATTTLQALVNLKRPTLLLQALDSEQARSSIDEIAPSDPSRPASTIPPVQQLHALKFNYDATTPLVTVTLSIHPSPEPVIEGKEAIDEPPKVVYTGTHPGGFNQLFSLPNENALDLSSAVAPIPPPGESAIELDGGADKLGNGNAARASTQSEDTNRSSLEAGVANLHVNGAATPDLATVPESGTGASAGAPERSAGRRLANVFRRGQREPDVEEAMEMTQQRAAEEAEKQEASETKESERGMRLLIRIEAVGEGGQTLQRRNAQLTHILITGMWVPDAGTQNVGMGKRVWVVKVVRREAIIGAHTFLLKEIYGLSSSTQNSAPAPSAPSATYPPAPEDPYASTPNECIVCLTSPRDVVLLPCRHLVVCRECAVGMVEFGAGGKVARRDEGAGGEGAADASATTAAAAGSTAQAGAAATTTGTTAAQGRERRKKKPKGWYCPVCRQPYTSLLRLALPTSSKPPRAPSIRSTRSLRRPPSIAPTLPDGAEEMLDGLRPAHMHQHEHEHEYERDSDEDDVELEPVPHSQRPQFVLGDEVGSDGDGKGEVEHREVESRSSTQREAEEGRAVPAGVGEGEQRKKGDKFEEVPL